jgi:hypothetical protein
MPETVARTTTTTTTITTTTNATATLTFQPPSNLLLKIYII